MRGPMHSVVYSENYLLRSVKRCREIDLEYESSSERLLAVYECCVDLHLRGYVNVALLFVTNECARCDEMNAIEMSSRSCDECCIESAAEGKYDIMRACVIDFGGSYQLSIRCAPFEALYGRKYMSPILWAEIRESSLIGPELVQEMTDKVVLIKEKLKVARDRQKSYADNRRKPLEFEVGEQVMLKVSP
ncbi:hypothetical protein Tco_1538537 [Tanacetum coccineum]